MKNLLHLVVSIVLLISTGSAAAEQLTGRIVGVSDGDTVTLLDYSKQQHKIRLVGIDAPESSQAFGQASKKNLSDLVFNREVTADCPSSDRYSRRLCKIFVGGIDANLAQIERGYAWHYKQYQSDQPPADRARYSSAEASARQARAGLWSDPYAIPPWDYRRGGGPPQSSTPSASSHSSQGGRTEGDSEGGPVKMSRSGICHAPGSTYYSRTTHFMPYGTLDACLNAGGRLPKR